MYSVFCFLWSTCRRKFVYGCCPGGALSNVLCYVFKADITLSIAMTTCSSLVSVGMLPLNCFIYIKLAGKVSLNYDWFGMIITTVIVILGTLSGLFISTKYPQYSHRMERFARVNMWIIIIGTIAVNNLSGGGLFRKTYPGAVYVVSILPSIFGCAYAIGVTTLLGLPKPARLAVAVECGLQNQILALSILTLTIKDSEARAEAYSIPILYAAFSLVFCLGVMGFFLRRGWTESKPGTTIIALIMTRLQQRKHPTEEIEKQSLNEGDNIENQITPEKSPTGDVVLRTEVELQSTTSIDKFSPASGPQEAKDTVHSDLDVQEQND